MWAQSVFLHRILHHIAILALHIIITNNTCNYNYVLHMLNLCKRACTHQLIEIKFDGYGYCNQCCPHSRTDVLGVIPLTYESKDVC